MSTVQSPRGTRDILPEQQPLWQHVYTTGQKVAEQMGFSRITTPNYEYRTLFERAIGDGTDVMDKELFLLRSRGTEPGQEEYALRPEGTAGIVRAFIEHGMHLRPQPIKLYTFVNNFRYDRPQKGRYREHVQFDLEIFGDKSVFTDAWVILAACQFLKELGLQNLDLHINSLGTLEERKAYEKALITALHEKSGQLSADSQARLEKNPLRILDSKDANDQALLNDLPKLSDFFGEESSKRFEDLQSYLRSWAIPFVINPRLVRGLDYYSHTVFELVSSEGSGQQGSLAGGGRYDGLVPQLGGQDVGAMGMGAGLDRIIEEMERQGITIEDKKPALVAVIAADNQSKQLAALFLTTLLNRGLAVTAAFDKEGLSAQLKAANKANAVTAYILGEEEFKNNSVLVKNLVDGSQVSESLDNYR